MELLKLGSQGDDVKKVQEILRDQGYYTGKIDGDYGNKTFMAVQEFQGGHINNKGFPLGTDGKVGTETWWALQNPSGAPQRSGIDPLVPSGLTEQRQKLLDFSCDLYRENIREIPDGSNRGDGVDKITGGWAAPWCAMYVSYVLKHALGLETFGARQAAVINIYKEAKELDLFRAKADYSPRPGDIFIMLYKDDDGKFTGKGHTGFVLRVSADGKSFNSQEGNCANSLRNKIRYTSQGSLIGFVNFYPVEEQSDGWERGVFSAKQAPTGMAGTR
jgi:hypothetical protein